MTFEEYQNAVLQLRPPETLKSYQKLEWLYQKIKELQKQLSPADLEKIAEMERNWKIERKRKKRYRYKK